MTSFEDYMNQDILGSLSSISGALHFTTSPPHIGTTVGPGKLQTSSNTQGEAAVAFELIPASRVNVMVSGIEVR
jgi:hypothetical protein